MWVETGDIFMWFFSAGWFSSSRIQEKNVMSRALLLLLRVWEMLRNLFSRYLWISSTLTRDEFRYHKSRFAFWWEKVVFVFHSSGRPLARSTTLSQFHIHVVRWYEDEWKDVSNDKLYHTTVTMALNNADDDDNMSSIYLGDVHLRWWTCGDKRRIPRQATRILNFTIHTSQNANPYHLIIQRAPKRRVRKNVADSFSLRADFIIRPANKKRLWRQLIL